LDYTVQLLLSADIPAFGRFRAAILGGTPTFGVNTEASPRWNPEGPSSIVNFTAMAPSQVAQCTVLNGD